MDFILKSLLQSANIFTLLIMTAGILFFSKKKKWSFRMLIAALVWIFVCLTRFIPEALIVSLESKYNVFDSVAHPELKDSVFIHVLGSGHIRDPRLPALAQLSSGALARLSEGIRIAQNYPYATIIVSGYSRHDDESHAEVLRRAILETGSKIDSIIIFTEPSNTYEESLALAEVLPENTSFILVTSANHMKRAHYLFKKKGLLPIAAPADFMVKHSLYGRRCFFCINPDNMSKMDKWLYETAGYIKEKIMY